MTKKTTETQWKYLEKRPHSWRKQLYLKGSRLTAFGLWIDIKVNSETPEEAADNWDLPLDAVLEVIEYCQTHQKLLREEADLERRYLEERGINLEPKVIH